MKSDLIPRTPQSVGGVFQEFVVYIRAFSVVRGVYKGVFSSNFVVYIKAFVVVRGLYKSVLDTSWFNKGF